jgi:hypothetical protein
MFLANFNKAKILVKLGCYTQVKEKIVECEEGCHVVERRNFHSFSNHVQSDNEDVIGAS